MNTLPPNHFLALPRPDVHDGPPEGVVDTTTLSAHDFDVDSRTGFLPPQPPIDRLPFPWEPWEAALEDATRRKLQLGDTAGLREEDVREAEAWRERVRQLPMLPTAELKESEVILRRAHHVLAWMLHFFVNTLPPTAPIVIPSSIAVPLLQVSNYLAIPPVLTYSDNVLYNWTYLRPPTPLPPTPSDPLDPYSDLDPAPPPIPTIDNLKCQTLFTGTNDEAEFMLTSTRIELCGVRALALMRACMDEAFVGDALALRRIAVYLTRMAGVLRDMTRVLLAVRDGCDPDVFYHKVRPWLRGQDAAREDRRWVFEGIEQVEGLKAPTELSGSSAGQSALIHAIDVFLGVDHFSHSTTGSGHSVSSSRPTPAAASTSTASPKPAAPQTQPTQPAFLARMQLYMPRHHRAFLRHLAANPRPIRALVQQATGVTPDVPTTSSADANEVNEASAGIQNLDLLQGYNDAVRALKEFRDAHLRIVALYIIGPSRRVDAGKRAEGAQPAVSANGMTHHANGNTTPTGSGPKSAQTTFFSDETEKGTGGTLLMPFLKSVRDRTAEAELLPKERC